VARSENGRNLPTGFRELLLKFQAIDSRERKTLITVQQNYNSPACVRAIVAAVGATGAHSYCSSNTILHWRFLDWASRIQCRTRSGLGMSCGNS